MSQRDTQDLNDKIYANWQRFYREGRINRRTLMQAMMVWAGAASVGGLLAACGGSAENTPSGGGAATAPSGGATAPAGGATAPTGGATAPAGGATAPTGGAATEGGMLRVILDQNDLPTMDPHMHNLRTGIIFFYHTHDNLGVRNRETNQIEPWLAESWRTSSRPSGR